jgi:hypothetical protein
MKLPSIIPLPRHQKFKIAPRFYDPIREDIQDRTERIRQNLKREEEDGIFRYHTSIKGSFSRRRDESVGLSEVMLRFVIIALLGSSIFGYIWYGPMVFFGMAGIIFPIYLAYRFKDIFRKKEL